MWTTTFLAILVGCHIAVIVAGRGDVAGQEMAEEADMAGAGGGQRPVDESDVELLGQRDEPAGQQQVEEEANLGTGQQTVEEVDMGGQQQVEEVDLAGQQQMEVDGGGGQELVGQEEESMGQNPEHGDGLEVHDMLGDSSYGGYSGREEVYKTSGQKWVKSGQSSWDSYGNGKQLAGSKSYDGEKTIMYTGHKYGGYGHHLSKGCNKMLMAPMNSRMRCQGKSVCIATCLNNFHFPSGVAQITITCEDEHWKVEGSSNYEIPSCAPTCLPACVNGGECTKPNYCECKNNYYGPYCQYERKPCRDYPALSMNSQRSCTNSACTVTCLSGHQFPDGSTTTEVHCKEGVWMPVRRDWETVPDCDAICDPPCQNGGNCLSFNTCQCPQEFRGAQCQYAASSCDVRSLGFNGNYNCSSNSNVETLQCSLRCPAGMKFAEAPARIYECSYATGRFNPESVPRCVFEHGQDVEFLDYLFPEKTFVNYSEEVHIIPLRKSLKWSCYTWNGAHFRTFNGQIKSLQSDADCSKGLIQGKIHFRPIRITTPVVKKCDSTDGSCSFFIVELGSTVYNFTRNPVGKLKIFDGTRAYSAPQRFGTEKVEMNHDYMIFHVDTQMSIKWNFESFVDIKIEKSKMESTSGICGSVSDYKYKEIKTSMTDEMNGVCEVREDSPCLNKQTERTAEMFCNKLLTEQVFASCRKLVSVKDFVEACKWDYCACEIGGKKDHECGCQSISMFVKECQERDGGVISWRAEDLCPMKCNNGQIYQRCGRDRTCGSAEDEDETACSEGCFCPKDMYLHNGTCVSLDRCPCRLRGKYFPPGQKIPKDCNTCTCSDGSWSCTKLECSARCEAVGDPHYITFDKHSYEFMGKCSYTLLQTENYTVEAENTPCDGSLSDNLGLVRRSNSPPSCTKSVTIKIGNTAIKLKQNKEVSVNGADHKIPASFPSVHIRRASSIFLQAHLEDGVDVMWDGKTRVYIHAPPSLKSKTKGLCGTFNGHQSDDFLTPEGDTEDDPVSFGNKWKTADSCLSDNVTSNVLDECPRELREKAELICGRLLNDDVFKDCDLGSKSEVYRDFCIYDMCSCSHKLSDCYCPIFAAFADRCAKAGYHIEWRSQVRECGIRCSRDQVYSVCGNTCSRSCLDIARSKRKRSTKKCVDSCVEGCYCPSGFAMDHREVCVPVSECPCVRNGLDFPAGHKEIRRDGKGPQLCTCENALWECHTASDEELTVYKNNTAEEKICLATKNQVYTHCEPSTPVTCQNMHYPAKDQSEAVCYGGCICKRGYVLDSVTNECVKPEDCPCHHGGRSYKEGERIQELCNTCECKKSKWNCTEHICPGTCTSWGDSHFKTFDGKLFDFLGACEYVLAKGAFSADTKEHFSVIVELVPCGSAGVSCAKSITLNLGIGESKETLVLADGSGVSLKALKRITTRQSGQYLFAEVPDMGIVLKWDRGTTVTLSLDPKWRERVKGLCGNYNNDYNDDFQSPSGGSESTAEVFGDSWKIHDYCPKAEKIQDTCEINPKRKEWSLAKCSILKSSVFKPCHSEVQVDHYMERCTFDACGCDEGGDCKCLCTAIAAYAQECNAHGVHVKWRSQDLCPIQCEEGCSEYSPCVSTCPDETCDNTLVMLSYSGLCKQDVCVEGCLYKPCPPGEIYKSETKRECVPKSLCKPICLTENGRDYFEGDLMDSDDCHRCYCSRNKKTCKGVPCTTLITKDPTPITTSARPIKDGTLTCVSGWSEWLNRNHHIENSADNEIESLPHLRDFTQTLGKGQSARCPMEKIVDINCRTVGTHLHPKQTGENVECSLERGLFCTGLCHDYEIQVLCQCGDGPVTTTEKLPTLPTETTKKISDVGNKPKNKTNDELIGCGDGEIWDPCAYRCDQLCHHLRNGELREKCVFGIACIAGCRPWSPCPESKRWRDMKTCVNVEDCTCLSEEGEMIKPGEFHKKTNWECANCQCLNNNYVCDESSCVTVDVTTATTPTTREIIIIPSTTTPPPTCASGDYRPLLPALNDAAFSASSSETDHLPKNARMGNSISSWSPKRGEFRDQYLQIDLGKIEAVYGVTVKGDPVQMTSVKTYHILHSVDGLAFSYVLFGDLPELFKGPLSALESNSQMFARPVEARYIRIVPLSWNIRPSLRIEVFGCGSITTPAPTEPEPVIVPQCTDKMSAYMNDQQIRASSNLNPPLTVKVVSVYDGAGWMPVVSDHNQWLEFDFLGPRILTGVMTAGSGLDSDKKKQAWIQQFSIKYSHNDKDWNDVVAKSGNLEIFKGNDDSVDINTVVFKQPIKARYVRIYPVKWWNKIALRAQMLGCYEAYPKITTTSTTTTEKTPLDCNVCPGATLLEEMCPCKSTEWWSGERCLSRAQCPCFVGFISYEVGTVYDNEACEQCVCGLSGVAECKPKKCPDCEPGLRSVISTSCDCQCKPCPRGERLCPTSNICIEESFWCDGTIDCPDDEINCESTTKHHHHHKTTTTTPRPTTTTTKPTTPLPINECPVIECPDGYTVKIIESGQSEEVEEEVQHWTPFGGKSKWGSFFKNKGMYSGGYNGKGVFQNKYKGKWGDKNYKKKWVVTTTTPTTTTTTPEPRVICPKYECIPIDNEVTTCQKPTCQDGYTLEEIRAEKDKCPQYVCVIRKEELPNGKCNVSGRTFQTFDGTEYKYDICDHTIARNVKNNWSIKKSKNCMGLPSPPCILIQTGKDRIVFTRDLSTWYNDYHYTIPQLQKVGAQNAEFALKQVSDNYLIYASIYDFSLIWDTQGNIKITVPGTSRGQVDGLCGYFDGQFDNDKRKPNGELTATSNEFGDSWGEKKQCENIACPLHVQKEAWKMCEAFQDEPLSKCESTATSLDKLMLQCVESVCSCMENGNATDKCRCQALLDVVTDCQSKLPEVDFSKWRIKNDCPVQCPPGLVYKECFNRICEPCCAELMLKDACPESTECFPGCYCPDGYVRSYERCIKPVECRDCQCDGTGGSRLVTFDRVDYTLNGKCTHTLSQSIEGSDSPSFKALVTHKPCKNNQNSMCIHMITLITSAHIVQVINDNELKPSVKVDSMVLKHFPFSTKWLEVTESQGKSVIARFLKVEIDLEFFSKGKGFTLKVPSHLYEGKTEGLCGSCNLNGTDDFLLKNGKISSNLTEFGDSWLVKDQPDIVGKEESCIAEEIVSCLPPDDEDRDPCSTLMHETFGKCHAIVDPNPYIESCHESLCRNTPICDTLETYARACQSEGICLAWRSDGHCPYKCPAGLEYNPCGTGCTETCDNYELLRSSPSMCTASKGDTCHCPKGKVARNNTCVEERLCKPCDSEGHYPGDLWKPDVCTECTCTKESISCQRIHCNEQEAVCSKGFKSVKMVAGDSECCPKFICVPEPTPGTVCPEVQQPACGFGQILKTETNSAGCLEFICQCKPKDECEDTKEEMVKERLPGMIPRLDTTGCCPKVIVECKKDKCPGPPSCPEHHEAVVRDTEHCCPQYKCAIPENKCLYEMSYTAKENGGEKERLPKDKTTVLKSIGDFWNDGPCRTCECREGSNQAICTPIVCQNPPESDNYVYTPELVNDKCCPIYKRKACKAEGQTYEVGQVWPSSDNSPCVNITCTIGSSGEVTKQELVETCKKDCKQGWKYSEPLKGSGQCCGECKAEGCVVGDTFYRKESIWFSPDNCTAYECIVDKNQPHIISSQEQCPNLQDCPEERIYQDKCCKKCNATVVENLSHCAPSPPPHLNDTIKLVQLRHNVHGFCFNTEPILEYVECKGTCDSQTAYNSTADVHYSKCLCCRFKRTKHIFVPMKCEDGFTIEKRIAVPGTCACIPCQRNGEFEIEEIEKKEVDEGQTAGQMPDFW